jgi:hypothetical protein
MRTMAHSNKYSKNAIEEPPVKVKPSVDSEVLAAISPETLEDSFVYVHCHFDNLGEEMLIRIWQTTFLTDVNTGSRSGLIHAENISLAPQWTVIPGGVMYHFLLIFSALPKSCTHFDLVEDIPQPGGFLVKNIKRNETDVYHIDI